MLVVLAHFVQRIVRELGVGVVLAVFADLFVRFCAKPSDALLVQVNSKRLHTRYEDVQS